jgi:hypothetical protein
MSNKIIISILILSLLFILVCTPPDEEAPVISEFTIETESPASEPDIQITLEGSDNVGITGWMITIDNQTPTLDQEGWMDTKPDTYTIPHSGHYCFYAWAKDGAGNVSEGVKSSFFKYVSPNISLTQETEHWGDVFFDGNSGWDNVNDLAFDSEDNIYLAGTGYNIVQTDSSFDAWIKKFDKNGVEDITNWNKMLDGESEADEANAVLIDDNDNIYMALSYGEAVVFPVKCWWLKKFDVNGNEDSTNWNIRYTDKCSMWGGPLAVAMDTTGNLYFAGAGGGLIDPWTSGDDWWIKKFSPGGEEIVTGWNKKFDSGTDLVQAIDTDSQNNLYAGGYGEDLVSDNSRRDWWIKKFAEDGTEDTGNWNKSFDNVEESDKLWDVAVDDYDDIYFVGNGNQLIDANSGIDWRIKKFDADGNLLWDKVFDGTGGNDAATSITIDNYGFVFVSGYGTNMVDTNTGQDWWIKMLDIDGNEIWEGSFDYNGESESLYASGVDSENSFYVAGYGNNMLSSSSAQDWWIMKFIISD